MYVKRQALVYLAKAFLKGETDEVVRRNFVEATQWDELKMTKDVLLART